MATRIEILSSDAGIITAAFYYPVPLNLQQAGASDPNRTAAGTRLSAAELQALKDGTLYEMLHSFSIVGFTTAQAQTRAQSLWTELQTQAAADYTAKYQYVGKAWDGTSWS